MSFLNPFDGIFSKPKQVKQVKQPRSDCKMKSFKIGFCQKYRKYVVSSNTDNWLYADLHEHYFDTLEKAQKFLSMYIEHYYGYRNDLNLPIRQGCEIVVNVKYNSYEGC